MLRVMVTKDHKLYDLKQQKLFFQVWRPTGLVPAEILREEMF
jgi:hypothetical protein